MIVKDFANTLHRGGRKAVRQLRDGSRNAGYIGVRFVGHQPAQTVLVPGMEFFHFGQVGVANGDAHKHRLVIGENHFVIFGQQGLCLFQGKTDAVRQYRFWFRLLGFRLERCLLHGLFRRFRSEVFLRHGLTP